MLLWLRTGRVLGFELDCCVMSNESSEWLISKNEVGNCRAPFEGFGPHVFSNFVGNNKLN